MSLNQQIKMYRALAVAWFVIYLGVVILPIPSYVKIIIMAFVALMWILCYDKWQKKKFENDNN